MQLLQFYKSAAIDHRAQSRETWVNGTAELRILFDAKGPTREPDITFRRSWSLLPSGLNGIPTIHTERRGSNPPLWPPIRHRDVEGGITAECCLP